MSDYYWDDQIEYLRNMRWLYYNDDYLEFLFLVQRVWKIKNLVDIINLVNLCSEHENYIGNCDEIGVLLLLHIRRYT
ncbi:hypothetical protein BK136_02600 [Paenibacillus amylolyticus]|nr:hypothetical protein BK136_02600 [Paenibacillus amylolyticus]